MCDLLPYYELQIDPDGICHRLTQLYTPWATDTLISSVDGIEGIHSSARLACDLTPTACILLPAVSGQLFCQILDGPAVASSDSPVYKCVVGLHIYTDGSKNDDGTASWAVIVKAKLADGTFARIGNFAGHVILDRDSPLYIGALDSTSYSAEVCAAVWAFAWVIQLDSGLPCNLYADNLAAVNNITLAWDGVAEPALMSVAVALHSVISAGSSLLLCHVKAHTGHPWNELADSIAKAVLAGNFPACSVPFACPALYESHEARVSWAVDYFVGALSGPAYPPINNNEFIITSPVFNSNKVFQPTSCLSDTSKTNMTRRKPNIRQSIMLLCN